MDGRKCFLKVNIKVQPQPFFSFPLTKSCSCMCKRVFFLSGGMRRPGPCHNTLLVLSGQEEPGSAPVTQLLMALVLSFGLTFSTCLLIGGLHLLL